MNVNVKVFISSEATQKFFGQGPYLLLKHIERTGSLRQASITMKMAYTKALHIIKSAENELGYKLLKKTTGGLGGGGSLLTDEAKTLMSKYEELREDISLYAQERFAELFHT